MDSMLPRSWEIRQNLLPTMRKPQQKGPVTLIFTRALWETLAHTSEYYLVLWSAAMGSDCCNISAGKFVSSTGGMIWEQAGPDAVSGCHLFGVGPIPQMNSHENFLHSDIHCNGHYADVTMSVLASQITDNSTFYSTVSHAHIKENINIPRDWPLCGESTGDRWIPLTKGQSRGKCFHLMTSSWNGVILTKFSYLDALEIVIVNFPCSQWQEFCQNDYLSVSVSRSEKKRMPFCRRHFHIHFCEWKSSYFDVNFTAVCSEKPTCQALIQVMAWHRIGDRS